MKKLLTAALAAMIFPLAVSAVSMRVTAKSGLRVRTRPDTRTGAVVALLPEKTVVEMTGEENGFAVIAPVPQARVYIEATWISKNAVSRDAKMFLRPDAGSAALGTLKPGTPVNVVKIDKFGWAEIEAPSDLKLYASKSYLAACGESPAAAPSVQEPQPAAAPESKKDNNAPGLAESAVKVLNSLGVDPVSGTYRTGLKYRFIKLESSGIEGIRFGLADEEGVIHYFAISDGRNFSAFGEMQFMKINGSEFRVPGWEIPLLCVTQVSSVK